MGLKLGVVGQGVVKKAHIHQGKHRLLGGTFQSVGGESSSPEQAVRIAPLRDHDGGCRYVVQLETPVTHEVRKTRLYLDQRCRYIVGVGVQGGGNDEACGHVFLAPLYRLHGAEAVWIDSEVRRQPQIPGKATHQFVFQPRRAFLPQVAAQGTGHRGHPQYAPCLKSFHQRRLFASLEQQHEQRQHGQKTVSG